MKPDWKQISISIIIGLVLGLAAGRWSVSWVGTHSKMDGKPYKRMLKHFNSRLDLSEDQQQKMEYIFEGKREKIHALKGEIRPRIDNVRNAAHEEIKAILNPEQQAKFEKLSKKWHKKRRKRWGHHGKYGPHGKGRMEDKKDG